MARTLFFVGDVSLVIMFCTRLETWQYSRFRSLTIVSFSLYVLVCNIFVDPKNSSHFVELVFVRLLVYLHLQA